MRRLVQRRHRPRRQLDHPIRLWGPMLLQAILLLLACAGLYYGITQKQAVQAALFDERTGNLKDQLSSLQRNVEALERYIVDLHRQEDRRQR
jgi:cell division protein FtsB